LIVYGDIDLADTDKSRYTVNLSGIYSRWDLLNLNVRQEVYEPVVPAEVPKAVHGESEYVKDLEARIKQLEQQITILLSDKSNGGET